MWGRRIWGALLLLAVAGCEEAPAPSFDWEAPEPAPVLPGANPNAVCSEEATSEVFERRIAPLLRQDRPDSCSGCHLPGIELSAFVRGDACQSMACMVKKRLVDLEHPEDSKILELINRGRNKPDDTQTRTAAGAEFAGFYDWILFSADCQLRICGEIEDPCGPEVDAGAPPPDAGPPPPPPTGDAGPVRDGGPPDGAPPDAALPDAAPPPPAGRCDDTTLRALFAERVWAWEGRCYHCHVGDGVELGVADAPTWISDAEGQAAIDGTYDRVVASDLLINRVQPDQSGLLLKPLDRRAGGVRHGGGTKFRDETDPAYMDFLMWIEQYADCAGGAP
jgi:hypothetical protein